MKNPELTSILSTLVEALSRVPRGGEDVGYQIKKAETNKITFGTRFGKVYDHSVVRKAVEDTDTDSHIEKFQIKFPGPLVTSENRTLECEITLSSNASTVQCSRRDDYRQTVRKKIDLELDLPEDLDADKNLIAEIFLRILNRSRDVAESKCEVFRNEDGAIVLTVDQFEVVDFWFLNTLGDDFSDDIANIGLESTNDGSNTLQVKLARRGGIKPDTALESDARVERSPKRRRRDTARRGGLMRIFGFR